MPLPTLPRFKVDKEKKESTYNYDEIISRDYQPNVPSALPAAKPEQQGFAADMLDKFQEGFYNTTGSVGTGLRGVFTDDKDRWDWEESQYGAAEAQQDTLSDAQKEADAKLGFDEEDELNLRNVGGLISSGLGSLGPSAIGGGLPGAALKGGATALKLGTAAQKAAQAAGYAAGGAVQIGGATKNQVSEEIGRMSPDNLMMMPDFKVMVDSGVPFEQARKQFAYDQSQTGLTQGGILGAVSMGTLGPVLERIVMGNLGKTAVTKILGGAGTEGVQEFVEEGGQQRIANPLTGKENWEGVLESAALGAIGGMGAGAAVGGAGALLQPRNPDDKPITDDQGNIIGYQDQKTGEKYSPIDVSQGANLPMSGVAPDGGPEIQTPGYGRGGRGQTRNKMPLGPEDLPSTVQNPTANKVVDDTGSLSDALNASSTGLKPAPTRPDVIQMGREGGKEIEPTVIAGYDENIGKPEQYEAPLEGELMGGEVATQDKKDQPALELDAIEGEFTTLQQGEQQVQQALEQGLIGPEDASASFQYIEQRRTELNDQLKEYQARTAEQYKLDKKAPKKGPFEKEGTVIGQNERGEDIYQDEEGKRYLTGVEGAKGNNRFYEKEDKEWKNPRYALAGEPSGERKTVDSEQTQGNIQEEVNKAQKILDELQDDPTPIKNIPEGESKQAFIQGVIDAKNGTVDDTKSDPTTDAGNSYFAGTQEVLTSTKKVKSEQFNSYKTAIENLDRGISQGLAQEIKMDERLNDGEADELLKLDRQKLVDKKKKSVSELSDSDLKAKLEDAKKTEKKFDSMGIKIDDDFASVPMIEAEIKKRGEITKEVPTDTELVDKTEITIGSQVTYQNRGKPIKGTIKSINDKGVAIIEVSGYKHPVKRTLDKLTIQSIEKDDQGRTDAQKEAGNYKKIHKQWNGLDISIENAEGTVRSGADEDGKVWEVTMQNDYGDIKGTMAADGENMDIFMGPNLSSNKVYVVNQNNKDGSFDEHKIMTGFNSKEAAEKGYLANYEQGWDQYTDLAETTVEGLKTWLKDGNPKKRADFKERGQVKPTKSEKPAETVDTTIPEKPTESVSAEKPKKSKEQIQANKELDDVWGEMGAFLSSKTSLKIVPDENRDEFTRILTKLISAAFKSGYYKFKDNARYILDTVREKFGDKAVENFDLQSIQGAYIAMSSGKKNTTSPMDVLNTTLEDVNVEEETISPIDKFYQGIKTGTSPTNLTQMRKWMNENDMDGTDLLDVKKAQEYYEAAQVRVARDIVNETKSKKETYDKLVDMYKKQPNLHVGTSDSVKNQAFSTPAPLAYIASELAGITKNTTVYEPTAGNGMLLMGADPKKSTVNELDALRGENLLANGFRVTNNDATTYLPQKEHDVMIANPPFGKIGDVVRVDGYKIREIDHLIAAKALKSIKDNGTAAIIIGANKTPGQIGANDKIFFNWLYSNYNVTNHFEVDGKLYSRQGAAWPVSVITVNGRKESKNISPKTGEINRYNTWEEIYEKRNEMVDSIKREGQADTTTTGSKDIKPSSITGPKDVSGQTGIKDSRPSGQRPDQFDTTTGTTGDGTTGRGVRTDRDGDANPSYESDRLAKGENEATGAYSGSNDSPEPNDGGKPTGKSTVGNELQTSYDAKSNGFNEDILTPTGLSEAMQSALNNLEQRVGNLDDYVLNELQYDSIDDMYEAFMGLQVDGVALAIDNIKRGKGMIIADQTGVGKGRQAAAIIRWTKLNDKTPIFVSEKPNLFTDMYDDLADIGTNDINPFIANIDASVTQTDVDDNVTHLFKNPSATRHNAAIDDIISSGQLPKGRNALFMTYSQINKQNKKRDMVDSLVKDGNAIMILDESHNAGGQSKTGKYISDTLERTQGALYLSATYAKRPDNIPLYFKTDLGDATNSREDLIAAIEAGGLLMQTVVSNQLAQSGQMVRREKSFKGISIKSVTIGGDDKVETKRQEDLSDRFTTVLRGITDADRTFHFGFVKFLQKQVGKGKNASYTPGTDINSSNVQSVAKSVDHTNFSSVVHNKIKQLLFVAKAEQSADMAIAAFKRGEKPVIALDDTLGSFLEDHVSSNGLKQGDSLEDLSFKNILHTALERSRRLRITLPTGDKEVIEIPFDELDPASQEAYSRAEQLIDNLDVEGLPVSPIDFIKHKIEQAGLSVKEITGRKSAINYDDMTVSVVKEGGQSKRRSTVDAFNSGKLDVIILNRAGSTGLSLHSSKKFKDQKKRHMIVAQPSLDINVFMQMLGRVNRTGQDKVPAYSLLALNIPSEIRPNAVLSKKMKSLNANTSSDTKSSTSVKSVDIINKYGDEVVAEYLREDTQLRSRLHVELDDGDIAQKTTGRLATLPVKKQKEFYNAVESQYNEYIAMLDKLGRNDLEKKIIDLQAKQLESDILYPGNNPKSLFGGDAIIAQYETNKQGYPPTSAEVVDEITDFMKGRSSTGIMKEIMAEKSEQAAPFIVRIEQDKDPEAVTKKLNEFNATKRSLQRDLNTFALGQIINITFEGEKMKGVVTGVKNTHRGTSGNPFAASKTMVRFSVDNAYRTFSLPLSKLTGDKSVFDSKDWRSSITEVFENAQSNSTTEKRYIVTGNLLQGITKVPHGNIIQFTKDDNTSEVGLLLPKDYVYSTNDATWPVIDSEVVMRMIRDNESIVTGLKDATVKANSDGGLTIYAGKSKTRGESVIQDETLKDLVRGNQFAGKRGSHWTAHVDPKNAKKALKRFMEIQPVQVKRSVAEEYGLVVPAKDTDDDLSKVAKQNVVEHEDFSFTGVSKPAGLNERNVLAIINDVYGRPLSGNSKFSNLEIINDKNQKWRGKFSPNTKKVTLNAYYMSKEDTIRILHHEKIHEYIKNDGELKKIGDKILAKARKYPNSAAGKALEIANRRIAKGANQYDRRIYEETLAYLIQYYNKPGHSSALKEFINTIRKFFAKQFGMFMNEADAVDYVAKMVKAESAQYQDVPVLRTKRKIKPDGKSDYSALSFITKTMPKSINDKINKLINEEKILSDKTDKAYEAGRLIIAGKLDARLAEIREELDSVVAQAETDYESSDNDTEAVLNEDIETSQDEDFINIWGNYKNKYGYRSGNKEELINIARGAMNNDTSLTDDEVFNIVKKAGERQSKIITAHKKTEEYSTLGDTTTPDIRGKVNQGRTKDTMGEMYGKFKTDLTAKMRQGLVDRYNALFEMDKKRYGNEILASKENFNLSSWVLAKMSTSSQGAVHSMIDYGRIIMDKNGALDRRPGESKSIIEVLKQLGSGSEINDFMTWIAANRGERLYLEGWNPTKGPKSQYQGGRENLFSWAEIQQGKSFNKGKEQLWNKVLGEFDQFRKDVLEISKKSGIISEKQAADFANEMYVPFYRVMTDDQISAGAIPGRKDAGRLSRVEAYKKLKGGKEKIGDLLENTLLNYNHLLSASLKNNAASQALDTASHKTVGVAVQVPKSLAITGKATFVMKDGKEIWYNVSDKLVYNALTSLTDLGMNHGLMKLMRSFKRVFTTATTASPQFITANFMRDSVHAAAIGKKTMSNNAATGFLHFNDSNRNKQRMIASGGAFSFGHIFMDDPDAIKRQIDRDFRKANLIHKPRHIGDVILKSWDKYQAISNKAENANRMAIYEQALKDGKSHQRAAFEARDLLDFSSRGEWAAIRVLTDIVPFLNARLQGLDVMTRKGIVPTVKTAFGKGTDSDKVIAKRFSIVSAAVIMASMALYFAYKDDEDFKKLEDWQRDTYWFFKIGDHKFFIPKPFEIGAMGTMAERTLEQMVDNKVTGEKFAERFKEMLLTTFAFNPTPQMIKPVYDVYANRDSFTGRNIETQAMRNLSPENRVRGGTTSLAENTSSALQSLFGGDSAATLSPVQIDFLIKNYLGWIGASANGFVDNLVNHGERPEKYWHEYQPIKRFYQSGESNYSKYTTQFYDNMKEVNRVYADIKHFAELKEFDRARKLLSDNKDKLPYRKLMNRVSKKLTAANNEMKKIRRSDLSQADKRRRIDALQQYKNLLTSKFKDI